MPIATCGTKAVDMETKSDVQLILRKNIFHLD